MASQLLIQNSEVAEDLKVLHLKEGAMNTSTKFQIVVMSVVLILGGGSAWAGAPPLEPDEAFLVQEDVNIVTGLYTREYSLKGNGVVDYRTARQIILSEYNDYWDTVVETREFPLFYWYDADQDGQFLMWIDRQVEGCICDIVPYPVKGQ